MHFPGPFLYINENVTSFVANICPEFVVICTGNQTIIKKNIILNKDFAWTREIIQTF